MRYLFLLIFFATTVSAQSRDWISPIDQKYSLSSPELFSQFVEARSLANSWRGRREPLDEATIILNNILEKDAAFAPAYREFGRVYIMEGYINDTRQSHGSVNIAEAAILRSIDIEPEYADSYMLLGHLYTNMKRLEDAQRALEKSESIGTDSPWVDLNWAELLWKNRRYGEALVRFQHVVDTGTSNKKAFVAALQGVASMHQRLDETIKANDAYKALIEYEPDNAWNWGNYADFLLYRYDDVDGAIYNCEKALGIMNYGAARFTLAAAYYTKWANSLYESNEVNISHQYFDKAWSLYPYPENIIEKAQKYRYTQHTARELQKRIENQ